MTISSLMETVESSLNRWKTLCEKEKLLVASNFSFSRSVFKRLVWQTRKNQGLFGKGLMMIEKLNCMKIMEFKSEHWLMVLC